MKYFSSILILTLSGCFNEKAFIQPDLNSKPKNNLLRYDGVYSLYDTHKGNDSIPMLQRAFLIEPIRFFENRYFMHTSVCYVEEETYQKFNKRNLYNKSPGRNQGCFFIHNDSLYMIGKFSFYWRGKISKFYIAHFRGYIKNQDTITDWKMIPPYPNIDFEGNYHLLNQNQPAMYTFKPLKFDSVIDPNKLWIIEEQQKRNRSSSTNK
jgi:hypothetical protein